MTVSFDRAATLRQAEKLLRQGKLEPAIEAYRSLVEEQPRDWTIVNQYGDALARAGRLADAVSQYTRIAEAFAADGFVSKAAAVYKKILKLAPGHLIAAWQAGEMAAAQGLLADARACFGSVAEQCRHAADAAGAARALVRLGELDPADTAARLVGARARLDLSDVAGARSDLSRLAQERLDEGREAEAAEALQLLLAIDPDDVQVRAAMARTLIRQEDLVTARPYLAPEVLEQAPDLALPAAEAHLRAGDQVAAAIVLDRLVYGGGPGTRAAVSALAARLARDLPDAAYRVAEQVTDACILRLDWAGASRTLLEFVESSPHHVPALTRLVEVCVDGGLAGDLDLAQAKLVDAYLAAGATGQARRVVEDLAARTPADAAHRSRLVRVLAAAGEADPHRAADEWLAAAALTARTLVAEPAASASSQPAADPAPVSRPDTADQGGDGSPLRRPVQSATPAIAQAMDVAGLLDEPERPDSPAYPPHPAGPGEPDDLEQVFARLRDEVGRTAGPGEVDFQRARALFDAGDLEASIEPLRSAARDPGRRFAAASLLARVFLHQRRPADAIEWLGHAADAPVDEPADRHRVLLQLADQLERSGEGTRALGVCLELQADAGDFGDLAERIARLTRSQA